MKPELDPFYAAQQGYSTKPYTTKHHNRNDEFVVTKYQRGGKNVFEILVFEHTSFEEIIAAWYLRQKMLNSLSDTAHGINPILTVPDGMYEFTFFRLKDLQQKTKKKANPSGHPFILGANIPVLEHSDVELLKEVMFNPALRLNGKLLKEILTSNEDLIANLYLIIKQNFPHDTFRLQRARKVQEHMGFTTSHETIAESRLRGPITRTFTYSPLMEKIFGSKWPYDPTNNVDFVLNYDAFFAAMQDPKQFALHMPMSGPLTLNLVAGETYLGPRMRLLPFILAYIVRKPQDVYIVLVDILSQDADLMKYDELNL